MKVGEPGHEFILDPLDGGNEQILVFVKRVGEGYPGNHGSPRSGTTTQEVLRALISRQKYVQDQAKMLGDEDSVQDNQNVIEHFRDALLILECRADRRAGRERAVWDSWHIEDAHYCQECGHIGCWGTC